MELRLAVSISTVTLAMFIEFNFLSFLVFHFLSFLLLFFFLFLNFLLAYKQLKPISHHLRGWKSQVEGINVVRLWLELSGGLQTADFR